MIERQIVIDNLLVNYYFSENQNPAAQTVVFLHGWGADAKIWQGIMSKLENCNCYALDLSGFGKSEMPKRAFTVGDYAEIVREFVERIRVNNVALVGHSFGGRIAIKCAVGGSIQKLVLVDSAGFRDESVAKSLKIILAKIAKPFVPASLRKKISKALGAGDYAESGELKQTFLNVINEDLTEDIKKINIPTLIVWGEDDKETPVAFGKRMNSHILNSTFHILPHAGHFSFLDEPERFVEELRAFIAQPSTGSGTIFPERSEAESKGNV